MDANCNLYGGESVYSHGRIIDRVRSGAYGYSIGKDIGLMYLPMELAKEGLELHVEIFGERLPAQVAMTPLVDPRGERLRA
jgi:dimethylglycine dehydrogenase